MFDFREIIGRFTENRDFEATNENRNLFERILGNVIALSDLDALWHIATHPQQAKEIFSAKDTALIIGAIIYIIVPLDAFPDWFPGGIVDDIGVITFILNKYSNLMSIYRERYM